jgi:hypothetical protein
MLKCRVCKKVHDYDEGPDTGECVDCAGPLAQDDEPELDYTDIMNDLVSDSEFRLKWARNRVK